MIYFFYPSSITGGAEYLMINTADLLCNAGLDVGVVDYQEGWVVNNITNQLIERRYLVKNNKIMLNEEDVLITTANYLYKLDNFFFESEAKVILWVVQPYNVILGVPKKIESNIVLKKLCDHYLKKKEKSHKKNLDLIINKNGIMSMDNECDRLLYINYFLNYNVFLPIFISDEKFFRDYKRNKNNNVTKMVWLGRIDLDFKIHILKKTLSDLQKSSSDFNQNFDFSIIGSGPGLDSLKRFVKENISFNVSFLGELRGGELHFVLQQFDLGFAMGTSALEIAAKGIPTILLDFSYSEVNDYKYRWIFETEGYVLGRDVRYLSKEDMGVMNSIYKILYELENSYESLANKSFNYVNKNHSSQNTLTILQNNLADVDFTLSDIYQYSSTKPIWNKLWYYILKFRRYM